MTPHTIVTGHVSAALDLPKDVDATAARTASPTLPGGWRLEPPGTALDRAAIEITVGSAGITADAHTVRVRLPQSAAGSNTLAYVTYTALERARQQQRKVTVHATALHAPGGRAVLLLGDKGAGKTSTALALAERGWVHSGDDLVVLGGEDNRIVTVLPGKTTAAVRDPHRPLVPKRPRALEPFAAGPVRLGWVVRIAAHPNLALSLAPATPLSANERLRLHENLARYISGLPTPLTGVDSEPYGPVWPLDTPTLARWRSHLITALAHCRFDYLYAPDPQTAADLLAEKADAR